MLSRIPRLSSIFTYSRRFLTNLQVEEEYYEDLEPSDAPIQKTSEEKKTRRHEDSEGTSGDFLETVVKALSDQRAKDVFAVKTDEKDMTPYSHRVVCSTFNARQAAAISENLRELLKIDGNEGVTSHAKRSTKRSNGWYVSEVDQVQVHVMSEECREKYDLEAIWAGDDRILEEVEAIKDSILLPPPKRND